MNYLAIFKGDSDEEDIVDQDYMYYDSETGCYTGINRGQTSRAKLPSKNNLRYLDLSGVGRAGDQGKDYYIDGQNTQLILFFKFQLGEGKRPPKLHPRGVYFGS